MSGTDIATQIQKQIAEQSENLADSLPQPAGFNISTEGKMFTLPNGRSEPGPLNVVILDFVNFYAYYIDDWVPGVYSPPVCWALARKVKELAPSENVEKKNKQNDLCFNCPMNQYKSAANKRGKACTNYARLAVVPANPKHGNDVMILKVAPKGLTGWAAYVERINIATNSTPIAVVTEISFNKNEVYPNLLFNDIGKNENLDACYPLHAEAQPLLWSEPEPESD